MRIVRTAILAGTAALALAGTAFAAGDDSKLMLVALPDGSVQHIHYQGDVAPEILFVQEASPAPMIEAAFAPASIFAEMERVSAAMDARAEAMLRQTAALQAQAAAGVVPGKGAAVPGKGVLLTNDGGQPIGIMQYSFVSSTTGADGCTRTVSYSSDGGTAGQPRVIRTSSGSCGSAPSAPTVKPTAINPIAKRAPAPKIIPVKAPRPAPEFTPRFTPSRT